MHIRDLSMFYQSTGFPPRGFTQVEFFSPGFSPGFSSGYSPQVKYFHPEENLGENPEGNHPGENIEKIYMCKKSNEFLGERPDIT